MAMDQGNLRDLTGQRFGRLTALQLAAKSPTKWLCKCDCGKELVTLGASLSAGRTKSCGCLSRELSGARNFVILRGSGSVASLRYSAWGVPARTELCGCANVTAAKNQSRSLGT
jgi:hypothetical protein